jgi:hypothetical protein
MKIENSLDWAKVSISLIKDLSKIPYNKDLYKMMDNISHMITELSKKEVAARQQRNPNYLSADIEKINGSIAHLEKLIFMATLMR